MASIMIQGTTSSAGKSLFCTGLCRIFKKKGLKVVPFKSQNMSSIFFTTSDGKKISSAQALQARAAGIEPRPEMNPILLIPKTDVGSKVIILGEEKKEMKAREYFEYKKTCKPMILKTFQKLEKENDIVVIEGAGSPAEINLNQNDIVNMGMAEMADAPVLLIADIDRGGVFAQLYGTVMLLPEKDRKRIKGMIINKFRGDKSLLDPGIKMIEDLVKIPVIATIPYMHLELADEDSLIDDDKKCNTQDQSDAELEKELDKLAALIEENSDMDFIFKTAFAKM
ncbi:cobyric acid synthase [Treponema denticola]|uniref:cobyric acid synthase n=1 Tax=Treponema denticola TaxID=158 RepID=UPI0002B57184|nr:cobyric acid synthase [Treponema denticola]EMB27089.1 cobyric acid synthase CobQ [Treponema denticola SP37]EPF33691.1 cobyric acid synthase CobQ [Treponema denticola SP44]EPF39757.1 cobyric acid synthase CobQ [Treponema denticola SP23]